MQNLPCEIEQHIYSYVYANKGCKHVTQNRRRCKTRCQFQVCHFHSKLMNEVTKGRLGLAKESRAQSLPLRLQVHTKTNTENNEKKSTKPCT